MADGGYGVEQEHARTREAHNQVHLLAHVGAVAMYGALAAGGLLVAKLAAVQPLMGIFHKLLAVVTEFFVVLLVPAINVYHVRLCLLLLTQPLMLNYQ